MIGRRVPGALGHTARTIAGDILVYLTLAVLVVISGYPLLWLIFDSLKGQGELYTNIWLWPQQPTVVNYISAWRDAGIGQATVNSMVVTSASVALVVVVGSLAGYSLARLRLPGGNLILAAILLTLMIRPMFTSVQLFKLTTSLGIIDTYPALVLPYAATSLPLAIALFASYFKSIPIELEDAARLDGATGSQVFFRIIIPLSGPVFAAVVIFTFLDAYNELFMALVLLKDPALRPLPPTLAGILGEYFKNYPQLFAGLSASSAPVIAIFLLFRKRFISGLTVGAIKG
jgi:raffinose/stachyose/melibiose transport system permease protein